METLPIVHKIDDEQFGKLIDLPRMYVANNTTLEAAKVYAAKTIAAVKAVDILTVDPLVMEALMQPVRDLRPFLSEAKQEAKDERMPLTRKMDTVTSMFVGLEKEYDGLDLQAQAEEIAWEKEKKRRKKIADDAAALAIAKDQEAVRIKADVTNAINRNFATALIAEITGMSTTYYTKTADDLTAYGEALKGWTPELEPEQIEKLRDWTPVSNLLTFDEARAEADKAIEALIPGLKSEFCQRVTGERDRLIDLIPSRIIEMKAGDIAAENTRIAAENTRIAAENTRIAADVSSSVESKESVVDLQASTANLESVMTHSVGATGSLQASKGTKEKQKYVLASHAAFVAILQSWVKSDMALLTIDELHKKLSFMITAANEKLNKGIELKAAGLSVEDDLKVNKGRR